MSESIMIGLKIMGFGMAGIFVAAIIIMIFVYILQALDKVGSKKEKEQ